MGIMDRLSAFNEDVEETTDAALDNDRASVQDTTRHALMRASGHEDDQEFAADSLRAYEGGKDQVTDRASRAADGTQLDNKYARGAGRGTESVFDMFVGYPGKVAYGSVTGVDTFTDNPNQAGTEYSPDALDTGEAVLIAASGGMGGVAAKGASRGGRAAVKTAKAAKKGDSKMLGGLARVAKKLRRGDDAVDSARAGSAGATSTRTALNPAYAKRYSKSPEALKTPDALRASDEATSLSDAVPGAASLKNTAKAARKRGLTATEKVAVGGGATLGALGLVGRDATFPDGYEKDHKYERGPGALRVRQFDADGNTLGYWVVLATDGGAVTALAPSGVAYDTSFPTDTSAPFESAGQADTAFERYVANQDRRGDTPSYEDRQNRPEDVWGSAEALRPLDYGWYLVEQSHNQEQKYRYFVSAKDANGRLLYIGPSGTTRRDAPTHSTVEKATAAYDKWVAKAERNNVSARPDTAQGWPTMDSIVADARSNGRDATTGGVLSSPGAKVVVGGGVAALVIALILKVFS